MKSFCRNYDTKAKLILEKSPEIDISNKNFIVLRLAIEKGAVNLVLHILSCIISLLKKFILSVPKYTIPEDLAGDLLCRVCRQSSTQVQVAEKLLEKCEEINPSYALCSAVSTYNTAVVEMFLRHPRMRITDESIADIKNHGVYVWDFFGRRLKEAFPRIPVAVIDKLNTAAELYSHM
jgi:hypothetical protein